MLKAILAVFSSYGIALTGKRKHAHFYHQLRMDRVYIFGLIFELEILVGVTLEEDWETIQTPSDLISRLWASMGEKTSLALPIADDKVPVMVEF